MKSLKTKTGGIIISLAALLVACGSQVVEFPLEDSAPPNKVEAPPAPVDPGDEPCTECENPPIDPVPEPIPQEDAGPTPEEDAGPTPEEDAGPPAPRCGDGTCNGEETCSTCAEDCGSCPVQDAGPPSEDAGPPAPVCGDGTCNGQETCSTCSTDCGQCPPPPPSCGDGTCNGEETCSTCSADCGQCPPPPDAGPPPPKPTCEDKDQSGWSCGHRYGCCVSSCAHTCHRDAVKTKKQCGAYQHCFKECQAECKEEKLTCEGK